MPKTNKNTLERHLAELPTIQVAEREHCSASDFVKNAPLKYLDTVKFDQHFKAMQDWELVYDKILSSLHSTKPTTLTSK